MKRYIIFLKDGRQATAVGMRLEPNVDRIYQGQSRAFVAVTNGDMETAVFLSADVLGWTAEEMEEESAGPHSKVKPFTPHRLRLDAS